MEFFIVHGKAVGYYTACKCPNWKRMKAYHAWKQCVQIRAMGLGIELPLHATKERPVIIYTRACFENGVHADPENVHKGIVDALFYGAKGGDNFVGGRFEPPAYDPASPRVEITIVRTPLAPIEPTIPQLIKRARGKNAFNSLCVDAHGKPFTPPA